MSEKPWYAVLLVEQAVSAVRVPDWIQNESVQVNRWARSESIEAMIHLGDVRWPIWRGMLP